MSYSDDRDSSNYGVLGGIGSVLVIVLFVGLKVGLRAAARASRNHDYSNSQYDNSPQYANLPETNRERSRLVSPHMSYEQQQAEQAQRQAEAQAAYNERIQQEAAQREADRQQREQAVAAQRAQFEQQQADERARREQQQAEQQALRDQQNAERQARAEEQRNQLANAFNAFNNPAAAPQPAPAPPPAAEQPPAEPVDQNPGFAVTELAQVKPRDSVFVNANGQWVPALVQAKRGQQIQVRDRATGGVDVVTLDRIRLEKEPVAKANSGTPNALRAVGAGPKPKANDDEDDSLFVAKPKKEGDRPLAEPNAPAVAAINPAGPLNPSAPASAGEFRTWTNDTGVFKVEATLVSFEFGQVQLRKRDGKVISLSLDKLSPADQVVVRGRFK